MAFLKVYTTEQLYAFMEAKMLASGCGLTNMNKGSRTRTTLEAVSEVCSFIGFDFLAGLRSAIPVAFFDAFDFQRKPETVSAGYLRFFRMPVMVVTYTGTGSDCLMSITALNFTTTCTGAPGDNLVLPLATYATINALAAQIDAQPSYSATVISNGTDNSNTLYQYTNVDVVASTDYLGVTSSRNLLKDPATAIVIPSGTQVTVDGLTFTTTAIGNILVGDANSDQITAQCETTGPEGNIAAQAIDTRNGKGSALNKPPDVDYVINDSAFAGGLDEETDDQRRERFAITVEGLAGSTVRGLEAATLSVDGIRSVSIRERYPNAGEVTVIADDGTGNLTPAKQQEILDVLNGDPTDYINFPGFRAAGILIYVQPPVVVPINWDLTLYRVGITSDENEIKNAAQTTVEQYTNTRKLGEDPILTEVIRRVKNAHPAIVDMAINLPLANPIISGSQLARTGAGSGATVTITLVTWGAYP